MTRRNLTAALVAGACVIGAGLSGAQATPRDGFFIGGGLSLGQGNFTLEAEKEEGDVGFGLGFDLGYAWANGFGLGAGLGLTTFSYKLSSPLGEEDLDLSLFALDLSAYYFLPVNDGFELFARAGVSKTQATLELGSLKADDDSAGVHVGVGGDVFISGDLALMFELTYRTYGVAFAQTKDEEVSTFGLLVGLRSR